MNVTMPDGTVITDVPEGTTQSQLTARYAKTQQPAQQDLAPAKEPSLAMAPVGGAEMLGKLVTGAVASIPAGLAYGGAAIARAAGANVNPAGVQNQVQNYFTYQPRSASGQAGEQALAGLARPVVEPIARKYGQATDAVSKQSPFAGELMKAAPGALQAASAVVPIAGGIKAAKTASAVNAETAALKAAVKPEPEALAITKAQDLGIKLLPSQQGRSVGAMAEGLSGQAKLERTLSKQNAAVVDSAVASEIGLPAGARVTSATLAAKKAEASTVYGDVAKLGNVTTDDAYRKAVAGIDDRSGSASFAEDTPASITRLKEIYANKAAFDSKDAVAKVRQLRADSIQNLKAPNAPEQNALGTAQRKLADILDDQMERHATAQGQADLVTRYKAARVQLAKLHSVEAALRGQNVSAKVLAQQQKRGIPLSGKLKDIADTYNSFDRVLQEPGKIRNSGPLDVVDYLVGAGAALHNPLLAAAALSRPLVRTALASDAYQGLSRVRPQRVPNALATSVATKAPQRMAGH